MSSYSKFNKKPLASPSEINQPNWMKNAAPGISRRKTYIPMAPTFHGIPDTNRH